LRVQAVRAYANLVPSGARSIDAGVREVVGLFNRIPGVVTRASCEGCGHGGEVQRHAAFAYIALLYPMPLQLQQFLLADQDPLTRIENDGVYSRWPEHNAAFIARLTRTLRSYGDHPPGPTGALVRWPLASVRSKIAATIARGEYATLSLCLTCADLVIGTHAPQHRCATLYRVPADLQVRWFSEFASRAENHLDSTLVSAEGWTRLARRTQDGTFGLRLRKRWLEFRGHCVERLATDQLREAVRTADFTVPMDFFYDATHVVLAWDVEPRGGGRASERGGV
jgi:hypothetical protein